MLCLWILVYETSLSGPAQHHPVFIAVNGTANGGGFHPEGRNRLVVTVPMANELPDFNLETFQVIVLISKSLSRPRGSRLEVHGLRRGFPVAPGMPDKVCIE